MITKLRLQLMPFVLSLAPLIGYTQFYPSLNASWCASDQFAEYYYHLADDPDTLISGLVYQRVREIQVWEYPPNPPEVFQSTLHIRSTLEGKGYIIPPDSSTEFLVGDVGAQPGDTLRDVLIGGPFGSDWSETWLLDIVVDSIVSVTNLGVTVTRHYVHEVTFWNPDDSSPYNFFAWRFYWQEGMGSSHGLILRMELALGGYYGLSCAVVSDSVVFNHFETPTPEPWGVLPGGQACCSPLNVGITNAEYNAASGTSAYPNPSSGLFRLWGMAGTKDVLVFDPQGRQVLRTRGQEIDLSGHAPGLYTALIQSSAGRQAVRLAVER